MKRAIQVLVLVMTCSYTVFCLPDRPPSIYVQPAKVVYFNPGETVQLRCIADGIPPPRYEWTLNNKLFDPRRSNGRIFQVNNSGTLVMYSPQPKDEGIYQCIAYNQREISMSVKVNFIQATMQDFSAIKDEKMFVVRGHSVALRCSPPNSIPKAKIWWIIRDPMSGRIEPVNLNNRVTQDLEGGLYITHVQNEDYHGGHPYACVASNDFMRKNTYSQGHIIIPEENNDEIVLPHLLWSSPRQNIGLLGEEFKLKCIFGGNPTPVVNWFTSAGNIPDNRRTLSSGGQELTFLALQETDEGNYTCYTMNNKVQRNIILTVKSRPYWVVGEPMDVVAPLGTNATFVCNAGGDPVPNVLWYINGRWLGNSNHMAIIEGRLLKHGNTVVVVNVKESDAMVMQCNASNNYGYIFADFYLAVTDAQDDIRNCPSNLIRSNALRAHNGLCYEFIIHHHKDWVHARDDCTSKGGNLAVVRSTADNNFLMTALSSLNFHANGAWIGLSDQKSEGHWQWVTGEPVTFTYWGSLQPGPLKDPEDCVVLKYTDSGHWHDYPCTGFLLIQYNYPWICEYKQEAYILTPEPTQATPSSTLPQVNVETPEPQTT